MARDSNDTTPLTTRAELIEWFAAGEKPRARFAIGTEHEKIPFYRETRTPVHDEHLGGDVWRCERLLSLLCATTCWSRRC